MHFAPAVLRAIIHLAITFAAPPISSMASMRLARKGSAVPDAHAHSDEERFAAWRARASARHPLYATAAGEVGRIPRGVTLELKPPAHGKGAEKFSDGFLGGPYRDTGLNTSASRHRFLKELDGAA